MSPFSQLTLEQLKEQIGDEKNTDHSSQKVQEQLDSEEALDPDTTSSL
jgi:hypothetical protein